MMLSAYFSLEELVASQYASRHGIDNTPDQATMINLTDTAFKMDDVRHLLGKPILVSSGYRSPALNKAIGGSKTSSHTTGNAVDFTCPTFGTIENVFDRIRHSGIKFDQLILEFPNRGGWVHIGFGTKARGQCLSYDGKTYSEVK